MSIDRIHPTTEIPRPADPGPAPAAALVDDEGPIPTFPPLRLDERGRVIPLSDEELRTRRAAAARVRRLMDAMQDDDPPGTEAEMMRAIDSHRPPGQKLFEGMY